MSRRREDTLLIPFDGFHAQDGLCVSTPCAFGRRRWRLDSIVSQDVVDLLVIGIVAADESRRCSSL